MDTAVTRDSNFIVAFVAVTISARLVAVAVTAAVPAYLEQAIFTALIWYPALNG